MSESPTRIQADAPQKTLRAVLRNPPALSPGDSLHRFVQLVRFDPVGALPVVNDGRLAGTLSPSDLVSVLGIPDEAERAAALDRPVAELMRSPLETLRAHQSLAEAGAVFARSGQAMLPVLDDHGYYVGTVVAHDLLVPELPAPRPARIGGMATPFGVYLTDGSIQAGVGNLALMASGAMMAVLLLVAAQTLSGLLHLAGWLAHRPIPILVLTDDDAPHGAWMGIASVGESLLLFVLFMALMRLTRLASYHAAEHQTVHAIERFEPLLPGTVGRMPRAHPRCGTNLMAAVVVFMSVQKLLANVPALGGGGDSIMIMAAIATLFVWRPIGTFLQERFTTKPAGERELASGIAAGKALMAAYLEQAPARTSVARRIWCSGMIQVVLGSVPIWALTWAFPNLDAVAHLFTGH